MANIDEPLIESAPLAWRLAPQLCRKDAATDENCAWYHGMWQVLRLMELASSASDRAEFYHQWIRASCADSHTPRILICGAADYAMLAVVLAAFRDRGAAPVITVVDLCETPLHLSRWYAERTGRRIETACADILEYRAPAPFDVVCTDGIFSRFAPAHRPALVAKWREVLRPGGRFMTTNRLRPGSTEDRIVGFSGERAQRFRDAVQRAMAEKPDMIRIDPREVAQRAAIYADRHDSWPVTSMEKIGESFERGGFKIDTLAGITRAGEERRSIRSGDAKQFQVVAKRL